MKTKLSPIEKRKLQVENEFLKLKPMERMKRMSDLFNDIIALKAKTLGVTEYEVYRRYLKSSKSAHR